MNKSNIIRYITVAVIILTAGRCFSSAAISVTFSGSVYDVLSEKPEASTGLDAVYVAYDVSEIDKIIISGCDPETTHVQKFSNMGGGYAQDVPVSIESSQIVISNPEGDLGYIVDSGDQKYFLWLVNYHGKEFKIESVTPDSEQDCGNTRLIVDGEGAPIHYYSINGRQCTLSREITASYQTLEWDSEQKVFIVADKSSNYASLTTPLIISPALLCNSMVTVSGDKFLKQWGIEAVAESDLISANGVEVHTEAVQTNASEEESSNMISSDASMLGGSAPADFTFYAYVSDAVIHDEWQLADDPDFEYVRYRFYERDLTYTFSEEGKYYVRYIGSDATGACTAEGATYEIGIGASDLRIPNAFSPDDDGVNDVWKVGYRSLVEFKCWIFDRNGRELFFFDKPDQGWDGKYKGKTVQPGVYYYVIEAKGADGVKYKKGGDINIIRHRKVGNSRPSESE